MAGRQGRQRLDPRAFAGAGRAHPARLIACVPAGERTDGARTGRAGDTWLWPRNWGRPALAGVPARGLKRSSNVTYIIAQPCVDLLDKSCIEECPVDCIYEGERMLYIHPDECVDCGACEPICPVEAIFYEDDVPDQWKDFYKANVEFFEDLGSPGGAAKVGKINKDHAVVAALPPQGDEH